MLHEMIEKKLRGFGLTVGGVVQIKKEPRTTPLLFIPCYVVVSNHPLTLTQFAQATPLQQPVTRQCGTEVSNT